MKNVAGKTQECNGTSWIPNTNKSSSGSYASQFANTTTGIPWDGTGYITGSYSVVTAWGKTIALNFYSRMLNGRIQTRIIFDYRAHHDTGWVSGLASVTDLYFAGANTQFYSLTAIMISPTQANINYTPFPLPILVIHSSNYFSFFNKLKV